MNKIVINGGRPLSGKVRIGGSKNAALPLLFAGILTRDVCTFSDLPRVSDVLKTLEILRYLGARIHFLPVGDVQIDYSKMRSIAVPATLTVPIRGSTYLLGAMLARFGRVELRGFGGCDFGSRPIDQHLMGFARLGAEVEESADSVILKAPMGLCGAHIRLAMPSVGATANLMMAACLARGESVIENAAAEPHVAALADFLQKAGAVIEGTGTGCIRVRGGAMLHGVRERIIPDMIEAGTYLCAGMACGGPVCVENVISQHLFPLLRVLEQMGALIELGKDAVTVSAPNGYRCVSVVTGPFPGFPTDLHPQMTALFSLGERARGVGRVCEMVWQSRFRYTEELCRMGADITVNDRCAVISPKRLRAAKMCSPDLRGGAALVLAALGTVGKSEIANACTIGRGYEHLGDKLRALGADIRVF